MTTRLALPFHLCAAAGLLAACSPEPDTVLVTTAPEVVSSIDGTTTVSALVLADGERVADAAVAVSVDYVDRNGDAHAIASSEGVTDERGTYSLVVDGLDWDGTGTITVEVPVEDGTIAGAATFAILDRSAPTATIEPPTVDLHVVQGQEVTVGIQVSDEIGVSEVWFEADGATDRARSSVVASGAADASVEFELRIDEEATPGDTITLYALAQDLSGNLAAAEPVVLTVDPDPTP